MGIQNLLALAGAASVARTADNDNITCSSFLNATSQADLDKIAKCGTFNASLSITTEAGVLVLNGVQNITGSLSILSSPDLTSFSAPTLSKVGDTLDLEGLTILDTLSMPQLTDLGSIKFVTLPALEQLQFNSGVQNARNILISDTALKSLEGLNLSYVDTLDVNNNKNIKDITVRATQIAGALNIAFNSDSVNVSLPNLRWVNNATFRYCASVSMPELQKVNNSLGFVNNTLYGLQLDKVQSVGSLTLASNSEMRNVSFANLTTIGGSFVIANNTHFGKIYGFPKLKVVRGTVQFQGDLTQASLPGLEEIDGGVMVESSNIFDCSTFDAAHKKGDIHGDKYVCQGKSSTISAKLSILASTASGFKGLKSGSGSNANATATSSRSGSSASKIKSKNQAVAPVGAIGTGLFGTLFTVLLQLA